VTATPARSVASQDAAVAEELIAHADQLVARIWAHFNARAAELSLSPAEAKTLAQLEADLPLPMRALAARVHANPSNITVIVARLEARGLVSREVSSDRRVKGVRLTRAGRELRERLARRLRVDHPVLHHLSDTEQCRLLELLRRLNAPD
jgi:DNA-binding MarR family transcriptional regulator